MWWRLTNIPLELVYFFNLIFSAWDVQTFLLFLIQFSLPHKNKEIHNSSTSSLPLFCDLDVPFIFPRHRSYRLPVHYSFIKKCQRTARQRLDTHPATNARNTKTNVYSSLLGNSRRANGLTRYLSRDLFPMLSAPCPVLSNRIVMTFTIMCFLWSPCRRFIGDSEGRLQSQMRSRESRGFCSWQFMDENGSALSELRRLTEYN
jgi:hypothetical protein